MDKYVVYLRGINVGGRNKIKMVDLRTYLSTAGFTQVQTYIQSGNVVLQSFLSTTEIAEKIEHLLIQEFELDSEFVSVLVLEAPVYQKIIDEAPETFGKVLEKDYRYDVMFLMNNVTSNDVMNEVEARADIDKVWQGTYAIYYRRPGPNNPDYTKSALSRIVKKPIYQNVTMRNWRTTLKMHEWLKK